MNAPVSSVILKGATLERSWLAQRLRRLVRGDVLFDRAARGRYATDASIYQVDPVGVVIPRDEADLLATIGLAADMKVPLLPRGAGTSQCGQTVGEALVVDCSRHLNEVIAFDRDAATVEVQPGIVLDALNAWLRPHGLWFPVDVSTSAQATLGGMAGNNSCGSRSIAYGNMVHNVLGIDAVLADGTQEFFGPFGAGATRPMSSSRTGALVSALFELGARERDEIERMWPTVMRRVGGYNLDVFHPRSERPYTSDGSVNLAHLLVGSEGTLAAFRRLHLRLSPLPRHKVLGVVNFASFYRAMDSAQHIVRLGPVAVELVDRTMIDLARANPVFRPTIDVALTDVGGARPEAILLVEFAGEARDDCLARLARLVELMGDLGQPGSVVELTDERAQKALWEVRKAGLNIMMSARGDGKPVSFIEDCAVPLEHLAEYTDRLTEVFARHGTRGTWYAHASVGTLHVRPILDMRRDGSEGGAAKMRAIAEEASALVRRFKGAYSGEHGDGLVRSEWVAWQFGPRLTRAFEEVKDLFDPAGLMNPGKIVRPSKMDDRSLFRFAPGYAAAPLAPALDWSAWNVQNDPVSGAVTAPGSGGDASGGFAKAVEMCNNNGHCRKFDADTMCPSYRVTRDEQHLTRGRANTLRLALTGQLGADGIDSQAVHDALDLCVSCKGCRRECPTGIDMARMKIEALHHYHAKHGLPLRERLIAALPRYAPLAARFAWLLNLRNRWRWLAVAGEHLTGFARGRSLPTWRSRTFSRVPEQPLPGVPRSPVPAATAVSSAASAASAASASASASASAAPIASTDPSRTVVLWVDTFNDHFEPEVLAAARDVLRAGGYQVAIARAADDQPGRPLCCGRTRLAVGDVESARREARRTLTALRPWLEAGATVVGLEPSCLLTMRDEFLVMGLGAEAERLAGRALLFEEFLVREHAAGRLKLPLRPLDRSRVLVHGHCHQKSFGAFTPALTVLGWIPGLDVQAVTSSCCGMAGAFGYAVEHQAVSRQMAEAALLPAVRAAGADAAIAADGTSCRHQIADGTGRAAEHVAVLLARALAD
ncbi:MAG TPA: FAD-linked oxidase C-terminal domain-containing protein [Burkholderiaceae bacterium]|nr:FAD-linked oxidase C-terminal domain-containing protein [Burkholderiaceae bacterium]